MFDGLKNIGSMMDVMKNAGRMQEKMRSVQSELARKSVTADAGGGLVTATVDGQLQLIKLTIDHARFQPGELSLLEDVIVSAVRAAQAKAAEMVKQEMAKAASELGLPPGMLPT